MAIIKQYDKRSNTTYFYESISFWDSEKKQSRSKRKLIGKLDPETGEMVPTNQRQRKARARKKEAKTQELSIHRKHYGATYLLQKIARKTRIFDDLKQIYPNHFQALLNLAYFLVLAPSNSMRRYEAWQRDHYVKETSPLTSQRISDLFQMITESGKQSFFRAQMKRLEEPEFWCYDTTSLSSYSETLKYVQYGFNKEHDRLPQLNLAYVYGQKSRLPIMYRPLAGNIPDVKTLPWLLSIFEGFDIDGFHLVMDRGFYSKDNVNQLLQENIGFIMGTRLSLSYVQEALKACQQPFDQFTFYDSAHQVYAQHREIHHIFNTSSSSSYPITLHIYYDSHRAIEERERFDRQLKAWQETLLKKPDTILTKHQETYFKKTEQGWQIQWDKIEAKKKDLGYFALISNGNLSSSEVLTIYRQKDIIEKAFGNIKERLNMRRTRVSSHHSLEGKLFVQHLALILLAYIRREMSKSGLDKDYSVEDLLDEVDRIEGYWDKDLGLTLGEVLQKQETIFNGLKIAPPQ